MPAPFTIVRGAAAPLLLPDVDTDVLAPAHGGRGDLATSAFAPLRYRPDGTEDPAFVLNEERFRGAPILLAGRNFGCGSSTRSGSLGTAGARRPLCRGTELRRHLWEFVQNGVLPIVLDPQVIESLPRVAATGGEQFVVDLEALTIRTPTGGSVRFTVDATRRRQLLAGLDDLGSTLLRLDESPGSGGGSRAPPVGVRHPRLRRTSVNFVPSADVEAIRDRIDHPIIDSDGHLIEYLPLVRDFLVEEADAGIARRLRPW